MARKSYRLIAILTLWALVLTAIPVAAAPTASDIKGHWAEVAIEQLVDMGAVSGLPDGTFRPDLTVTRAEFVSMVNKSLGITPVTGSSHFRDVKPEDWFAGQVEAPAGYGYVAGNPDETFSPYRPITREQAAAMLVRAFSFSKLATEAEQNAVLAPFTDANKVSAWARADVATAVNLGLMSGYTATTLAPQPVGLTADGWQEWEVARSTEQREAVLQKLGSSGLITRAQTAAILVRALDQKLAVEVTEFDEAGTYGPKDGMETISGDVIIKAEDVTLQNLIITGDLIIAESVGDGTVLMENVTVKGDTKVKGGGTNSVIFRDCTLHGTVTVEKVDGKIRIVAEGSTSVPTVILQSGAILISTGDGSFEQVLLPEDLDEDAEIVLTGNFAQVEIEAERANVTIGEGSTVDNLVLTQNATGTQVDLDRNASVNTVTADARVEITGQGSIGTAEINVDGVTIEQKPDKTVLEPGIKANVGGKDVSEPKKSSGGGGGGGGGGGDGDGDETVPVSAISVEGVPVVGETLTADPHGATVTYKWMKSDTKDGAYVAISGATAKTYTLVEADAGKWIKVEVKGTGNYTGTKISDAVGSVEAVEDPQEAAKAAFLEYLKVKVADIDEAAVVIDEEENISVSFKWNAKVDDVYTAANELVEALKGELNKATLTLSLEGKDSKDFNLENTGVAVEVARYLLGDMSPEAFLAEKATVTATYEVEATNNAGVTFNLEGNLAFGVGDPTDEEVKEAKAAFLTYLKAEVGKINVASVGIDEEENISVSFKWNAKVDDVYTAANELVEALKGELNKATLTLSLEGKDSKDFNLENTGVAVEVARYLLGDMSPEQFLAEKATVTATYEVKATNNDGVTFKLEGNLAFGVGEPTDEEVKAAKDAFLGYLDEEVGKINIASVNIDEEDISVSFKWDSKVDDVHAAANELIEALKGELDAATLTLIRGEGDSKDFDLNKSGIAVEVARYLLNDKSPEEFLAEKATVTASYKVKATNKEGVTFNLEGSLEFTVGEPTEAEVAQAKEAFLNDLKAKVAEMDVADVAIDEDENISVSFKWDSKVDDVHAAANELIEALKGELDAATLTLIRGEGDSKDFDLNKSGIAVEVARYLLNDKSPEEFLAEKATVTASYKVKATNKEGVTFNLEGSLEFTVGEPTEAEVAQAKEAFLNDLKAKVAEMDVADVAIDEDENISVSFKWDSKVDDVHAAANELIEALKGELDAATLTLIRGEGDSKDFDLNKSGIAVEVARYLLNDKSPEEFLAEKATVTASYKVKATNKEGVTFNLEGSLEFTVGEPTEAEVAQAKEAFLNDLKAKVAEMDVADVAIDEDENISVSFKWDSKVDDVHAAANELIEALKGELDAATLTLIRGEGDSKDFDLNKSGIAVEVARYLLNDKSPEEFLAEKATVTASYKVKATNKEGVTFNLEGSLEFTVTGPTPEEVIAKIDAIPEPTSLTVENRILVVAARDAYNALTEAQQALVTNLQKLETAEASIKKLIEDEIATTKAEEVKPAFIGFADVINKQAPKSDPAYRLWVKYDLDALEVTFLFSKEAQGMGPYSGLQGTGLKTAFYSLVNVPKIQGASAGGKDVKFKDEDGNPRSGDAFEWDLMEFGVYLLGDLPSNIGEIIGTDQIMDLDCRTASGIEFSMEIKFLFKEAIEYLSVEDTDIDITVPFGTTKEDAVAKLSDTLGIIGADNETAEAAVSWTITDYNGNEAGEYIATGKFILPIGWAGNPGDLTAKVTVAAPTYTLTLTGDGLTAEPEAGDIEEDTEVTITVTPPDGKHVATFTVNGEDKIAELVDDKYTFTITADTSIAVTYEETLVPNTIEIKGSDSIEIKLSGDVTETYTATVRDQNGNEMSEESVTWALKEAVAGVSVDTNTGKVTVADTTTAGSFTVVATSTADAKVKAEKTVTLTKEKNNDATLKALMVNGDTVEDFTAETLAYNLELPAGTTELPTVTATATDTNATVVITQATSLDDSNNVATIEVTAEDGSATKTYTITFTVAPNEDQDAPTGLQGVAPTTEDINDGKIMGTTTALEYKLASAEDSAYATCGDGETTNLAPGTYYVRYAAKPGCNASAAVEVIVPEYQPPVVVAEIDKVEAENGKVTITLKEKPTTAPMAEDFSATITINVEGAETLTLGDLTYNGDVTVSFTFDKVEATDKDQEVVVAVTLGDGDAVVADAFTVEVEEIDTEAAKQAFLDAVTKHDPESDMYVYSFNGKALDIKFDFKDYVSFDENGKPSIDLGVAQGVMEAGGEFLTAIFIKGKAQQIVINMNGQELEINYNSGQNEIIALAGAVFNVDASNGNINVLMGPVFNFLGVGAEFTPTITADFTMTVTNQDDVEFILEDLTATFTNNTEELNEEEITETTVTIDETQFNDDEEAIEEAEIEPIEVTDEVSVEGGEEVKEETENVEDTGEENQETPVVEEEDNEGVNDEEELENGGEEDAV